MKTSWTSFNIGVWNVLKKTLPFQILIPIVFFDKNA